MLLNALDPSNPDQCNFNSGEKWLFLRNFTAADANILTGVNALSGAAVTPVLQPPTCDNDPHLCSQPTLSTPGAGDVGGAGGTLDHLRFRATFSFHPEHSSYPFATQTLPVLLEFPFSTTGESSAFNDDVQPQTFHH